MPNVVYSNMETMKINKLSKHDDDNQSKQWTIHVANNLHISIAKILKN